MTATSKVALGFTGLVILLGLGMFGWSAMQTQRARTQTEQSDPPDAKTAPATSMLHLVAPQDSEGLRKQMVEAHLDSPPDRSTIEVDDLPINERITRLIDAADQGDPWAACVADVELERCRKIQSTGKGTLAHIIERVAQSQLDDEQLSEVSRKLQDNQQRLEKLQQECKALPKTSQTSSLRMRLIAASSGDTTSMLRFATAKDVTADILRDEGNYALYRQNAWLIFLSALQAGETEAVQEWLYASGGDAYSRSRPLAGLLPPEWRDRQVAAALLGRIYQERLGMRVDRTSRSQSQALADDLYQRYFAHRIERDRAEATALMPPSVDKPRIKSLTAMPLLDRNEARCDALRQVGFHDAQQSSTK